MSTERIPQAFIEDIIARSDIVEIIQSRVSIKKRGKDYHGLCPFHEEKTPSFSVSPGKQFYYCFGCGANGNVISFLMNYDSAEFLDVLTQLASQHGLEVPRQNDPNWQHHKESFAVMEEVNHFYQQQLKQNKKAIDYLKSRGLTGAIAKKFAIGFAPDAWEILHQAFKEAKSRQQLIDNGLVIQKENRFFDRFRNRIMFPIRNTRGHTIAFGGRTLGQDPAKYMNSPETSIFHKSNELYGLYECRQTHNQLTQLLIVEGYMDVVSLAQQGIDYAVATLGTAVTDNHLQILLRSCNRLIFCFDGDAAGRRAAWKALTLCLKHLRDGLHIHFLFLAEGEDPDSLVQKIGQQRFEKMIQQASPLTDFLFEHLKEETPLQSLAHKAEFAKQVSALLNTMPEGIFRELLYQRLAQELNTSLKELNALNQPSHPKSPPLARKLPAKYQVLNPTNLAISLLLQDTDLAQLVESPSSLSYAQHPLNSLLQALIEILHQKPQLSIGALMGHFESQQQAIIARLASWQPEIAVKLNAKDEFLGSIKCLTKLQNGHLAEMLIEKSRSATLSEKEKIKLKQLLSELSQ